MRLVSSSSSPEVAKWRLSSPSALFFVISFRYFLQFLVPVAQGTTAKAYEHTRARAEEAIRQFGSTPLRDLVSYYSTERAPLLCAVRDDEAFFSLVMRFACGESAVAVIQDYSSSPEAVLGSLSVFDMLSWLDEDMTLLSTNKPCISTFSLPWSTHARSCHDNRRKGACCRRCISPVLLRPCNS